MTTQTFRSASAAIGRLVFDDYLRVGGNRQGTEALVAALSGDLFVKYNHNHDPRNGQFTFGDGTSTGSDTHDHGTRPRTRSVVRSYNAATVSGIGLVHPISGGYFDANGRYIP